MSFWVLLQILIDLVLVSGGVVLWVRLHKPAKDDPRLSRGLQLLQSKIAVLEDLSDRTETQVSQLTAILETKCREIQEKIGAADRQIAKIDSSAQKSLEVAKIFQDRIPHTEILERQNTIKYVKAAQLAHAGESIDEIARQVDLTRAEIEFIATVNRDQLQFSEADLPAWARGDGSVSDTDHSAATSSVSYSLPRENFAAASAAGSVRSMQHSLQQTTPFPQSAPTMVAGQVSAYATSLAQEVPTNIAQKDSVEMRPAMQAGIVQMNPPPVMGGQMFMELDLGSPSPAPSPKLTGLDPRAGSTMSAQKPAPAKEPQRAQTTSGKSVEIRPVNFPRIDSTR